MSYKTEFNSRYNIPPVLQGAGWFDNSWHNDVCPKFDNPGAGLRVWVDYENPETREIEGKQYNVQAIDEEGEPLDPNTDIGSFETAEELTAFIAGYVKPAPLQTVKTVKQGQTFRLSYPHGAWARFTMEAGRQARCIEVHEGADIEPGKDYKPGDLCRLRPRVLVTVETLLTQNSQQ